MAERNDWKNRNIGNIKIEKNPWVILFILLISIFALLINGYRYDVVDHALYIPMIDKSVNPDLFPNDYLFDEPSEEYNFWTPTMALLARFFSLEWIFFVGYALTRFGLFWAIYHVSLNLFGSRSAASLAVLLLVLPKPVGGTATATQDTFFTLRSTTMPLAIAFLIPYFRGCLVLAAILCGIAFLIHPITTIPLIFLLFFRLMIDGFRHDWRPSAKAFGVFLICIFPLLVRVFLVEHASPSNLSFFSRSDLQWIEIIRQRNSYIFFSAWRQDAFLSLAAYFTILLAILLFRRWYSPSINSPSINEPNNSELHQENSRSYIREADLWAYGVIIVCAGLFIIGGVFVEWYPLPLVVQLQVVRSSYLLVNAAIIYAAWLLWEAFQQSQKSLLNRQSLIRQSAYSSICTVIPVFIAALFMAQSTNQLILGGVTLICWWMSLHLGRRHLLFCLAGGLIWLAIILWFRGYFLKALDWQNLRIVLIGFAFIEIVHVLGNWRSWERVKRLTAACLLITTVLALITFNFSRLKRDLTKKQFTHHINLPGKLPRTDWIDVQQWCRANTPTDAMFLVPRDIQGFRTHSHRSIVADWKDGAPGVFSEGYAKRWWSRMEELNGYDSFDETRFKQLSEKYKASFAVTRKSQRLNLPIVYQNNGFIVYSLDN